MNLTVDRAKLIESRSDERDGIRLANSMRAVLVARGSYAANLTTTSATPAVIWQDTVNADSSLVLMVHVAATDGTNFAAYSRRVVVTRDGSANAVIRVTDTIGTDVEDVAAWDVTFAISTGDIALSVTGVATWRADITAVWSPFQ